MHELLHNAFQNSFMMEDKYRYVRGKIFDGGNEKSAIKLQIKKIC